MAWGESGAPRLPGRVSVELCLVWASLNLYSVDNFVRWGCHHPVTGEEIGTKYTHFWHRPAHVGPNQGPPLPGAAWPHFTNMPYPEAGLSSGLC